MSFPSGACLPPLPPQSYSRSNTSTVDDQSDSDDTFFVPRPRRPVCQGQRSSSTPPRSSGMVLISTTSRNLGDEFCDVSLENAGDVKGNAGSNGIKSESSKVRKNLRQIANKIRSSSKEHRVDSIRPACPPNPSSIRDTSSHVIDLPPFEAFGGREQNCACGNVCEGRGGFPCRAVCCPEEKLPQQPPPGTASPPAGYGALSSLMRAADDVTYGDSDTATAGSDTGTHYSARRRRISSSIASVSTERSEGENKPGGGEKGAEIRPGTWKDGGSLRKPSLVDGLLLSIYRNHQRYRSSSLGESDTMTEHSTTSEPAVTRYRRCFLSSAASSSSRVVLRRFRLQGKNVAELKLLVSSLEASLSGQCALLVRELKKRDKLRHRRDQQNDVVTAVLHALSLKRNHREQFNKLCTHGDMVARKELGG